MRSIIILASALVAVLLDVAPSFSQTARIAVGAASVAHLPGWTAVEGGYFSREGLLLGGDVSLAQVYSQPLLSARLSGADTLILAGLINQPLFSVMSVPSVERPQDLRRKRVGITTYGSASDLALRLALRKWGLNADTDVSILQVRGIPEILGALRAGAIDAGIVSPPTNIRAVKAGFRELAYLPKLGISFQHTTLSTTRRYIARNRETTVKMLKAYIAGIRRIKSDKAFSMRVLSKYLRTTDPEVLEYTHNSAVDIFQEIPYPTLPGIQSTLDFLGEKDPKARQAKPNEFVDLTLLEEIERSGF
jgi:ABC-type nitrate/sulfonate/bicarbonate transport system substrate-binding protein